MRQNSAPSPRAPSNAFARAPATGLTISLTIALVTLLVVACAPAPASVTIVPATLATIDGWNVHPVADPTSHTGTAVRFDRTGTAAFRVSVPSDVDTISLVMKGDQCDGPPAFTVTVDNLVVALDTVPTADWSTRTYTRQLLAGTHAVSVSFADDQPPTSPPTCDRNLLLDELRLGASPTMHVGRGPSVPAGFVHQVGTQLLDGANRPIKLKGVNLGGWLLWEGWIWGQSYDYVGQSLMLDNLASVVGEPAADRFRLDVAANLITGDDFAAMSHYGLNAARVPFNSRMLEDDDHPFTYKESGWAILDNVVAQAKRNNVYLVLDMHAAPCSQSLSFISDWNGTSYLWTWPPCIDRTVALWRAIAARYRDQNIVAGYDLLNETVTGDQQLVDFYRRTTDAIRQVDPNHTVIYEGNNLARDFAAFPIAFDANQMLSAHDYPWQTLGETLADRLPLYNAAATQVGSPLWIGEFGQSSYDDIERYVSIFDLTPAIAGWAQWTWKQIPGNPALQTIRHTAASKKLIEWMTNNTRPRPTYAEAQQGMADWINAISFRNTTPDARLQDILGRG